MKGIIGGFTLPNSNEREQMMGETIANVLLENVKSDKMSINDPLFKNFLPVVFAKGNLEFLRVMAEKWYVDDRRELILKFIDDVEKMTLEGAEQLKEVDKNGSNR